jgi:HEAT repeat protein
MRSPILRKLEGGDCRSIGKSGEAVRDVFNQPLLFADLFSGLLDADSVVRMRAADAVEKIMRQRPELLHPWKKPLLERVSACNDKAVRWHVAQMIPRLTLTSRERSVAIEILKEYLNDSSSIVRTFSMQALADLAGHDADLRGFVLPLIERLSQTGTPAMRSRGRALLKQLAVTSTAHTVT